MKNIKQSLIFWIKSIRNKINFYFAKKKANQLHKLTGKRYHVLPRSDVKLMVVDNDFVNAYNKVAAKKGCKKINIYDLLKMSYYSTSVQSVVRN
jgi:hypothetical protein